MSSIQQDTVMRVQEVHNSAGGKGLNVTRVAAKLGEPVIAMGFTGGFNGQYLESLIAQDNVQCAFTHVQAETRCCINCWDLSTGKSTEFLEPGAAVTQADVARFFADFDAQLPMADAVAVSGSVPKGVPDDVYCQIIRRCKQKGIPVLLDTSGERLTVAAAEKPSFLKPNTDEISQLTGSATVTIGERIHAVEQMHSSGIACAVLSMGEEGALLACDNGIYHGQPPRIMPKNTVGCGDSMVAGFAVGFARKLSTQESFRIALAVSAANALSLYTGDFDPAEYERLYDAVSIKKVK